MIRLLFVRDQLSSLKKNFISPGADNVGHSRRRLCQRRLYQCRLCQRR